MSLKKKNGVPLSENEFKWEDLLYDLQKKKVIPVLGTELFTLYDSTTRENVPLYSYMHRELMNNKRFITIPDDDYWEFMEKNKQTIPSKIQDFLITMQDKINNDPLLKLARITDFEYYICLTYDNFFTSVLQTERAKKGEYIRTIDYSMNNNSIDESVESREPVATVFNLMGSIERLNGFAKTEEEVLEHLYSLKDRNKFTDELFDNIEDKHFLFIGCDCPDWLLRFMIRIITRIRLKEAPITKVIADTRTVNDKKLCLFLNHYNSKVYPVPSATSIEFVDKLYAGWHQGKSESIKYKGEVFLSYCSDDRETFARKIYESLQLKGVEVFFDEAKIDSGDYFSEKIQKRIKSSKLFIPLISDKSLDPLRYTFKEWDCAVATEKAKAFLEEKEKAFIKPFVIDATKPTDERIQKIFSAISIKNEKNINKITDFIISNLEKCQT